MKLPESPLSLWLDIAGPYEPRPPLEGDVTVDVAVVGGGFTGLSTARELVRSEPGLRVALLEAMTVGYGASGRNGSFGMTVVGLGFGVMASFRGKRFVKDSHAYMERAVDTLWERIEEDGLDCNAIRPGFLRVATTPAYVDRIRHDVDLVKSLDIEGIDWIEADEVRARVDSEHYLGAMWERRLVLVDPAKLVREERRVALELGVSVYESTPVLEISTKPRFVLSTPNGTVTADKLVLATNAYSHLLPGLKRKQIPAFTYMIATEPIPRERLDPIGWKEREGLEDARNLIHYYRLTPDDRLVMGGGPVGLTWANALEADSSEKAWAHLEEHMGFLFPSLRGVKVTHRWGGPFSVTIDLTPAIGHLGDPRCVYSLGCIGHGVSMSHLNGRLIADMVLELQSDLLDCPFVDRRVIPWPPEPLRMAAITAIRTYLRAEDWAMEGSLRRAARRASKEGEQG